MNTSQTSKQGLLTLISAIAIQLTLGIAYIWSVFQTGVAEKLFDKNNDLAALTFSLLLATLTIGSVIGGKLAAKFSTRAVVLTGGVILSLGFFLAGFVTPGFSWALWLTYGVMGGLGMGFTYSTTIACAQKWFPHKKGLVTGIIVSALGFGGVVFTPIVEALIVAFGGKGAGEAGTFMVLAGIFLTVCTVGALFLKNPPDGYMADKVAALAEAKAAKRAAAGKPAAQPVAAESLTTKEMLKKPQFYLIAFTFMLACMGGLMMIGFAKPIAMEKLTGDPAAVATAASAGVMVVAMFNALGRLLWGIISDKLGRINTIFILLSGTAAIAPFVLLAEGYWIFVLIAAVGFFYGGLLSTFPALTAEQFGPKNLATNYGFVLLGFGAGAVLSSFIAGHFKNLAAANPDLGIAADISRMLPAFLIAAACAAAGIAMMLILKLTKRRQDKNLG